MMIMTSSGIPTGPRFSNVNPLIRHKSYIELSADLSAEPGGATLNEWGVGNRLYKTKV